MTVRIPGTVYPLKKATMQIGILSSNLPKLQLAVIDRLSHGSHARKLLALTNHEGQRCFFAAHALPGNTNRNCCPATG